MSNNKGFSHHHILFQRKHYNSGYAHKLRSEKYFIIRIPNKLHATIHAKIHDIPTPNGADCRRAYQALQEGLASGKLTGRDTIMQRLSFLIDIWEDTCPATTAILKWCRDITGKYYSARPSSTPQSENEKQNNDYTDIPARQLPP